MLGVLVLVFACPLVNFVSCAAGSTCPPVSLENYCYVVKEFPRGILEQGLEER